LNVITLIGLQAGETSRAANMLCI